MKNKMNLKNYHSHLTELLESALISLCCESLPSNFKIEIDGLVCVSLADIDQQIVVKIHRLIAPQYPSTIDPFNLNCKDKDDDDETDESLINVEQNNTDLVQTEAAVKDMNLKYRLLHSKGYNRLGINVNGCGDGMKKHSAFTRIEPMETKSHFLDSTSKRLLNKQSDTVVSKELRTCALCFKKFSTFNEYGKHISEVHNLHGCHKCPKLFTATSNLNRHMKLHLGIKQYRCQLCHAAFARNYYLKQHMNKHISQAAGTSEESRDVHGRDNNAENHINENSDIIDAKDIKIETLDRGYNNEDIHVDRKNNVKDEDNGDNDNIKIVYNVNNSNINDDNKNKSDIVDDNNENSCHSEDEELLNVGNLLPTKRSTKNSNKPAREPKRISDDNVGDGNSNNDNDDVDIDNDDGDNIYDESVGSSDGFDDWNKNDVTYKVHDNHLTIVMNPQSCMRSVLKRKLFLDHNAETLVNDAPDDGVVCHSSDYRGGKKIKTEADPDSNASLAELEKHAKNNSNNNDDCFSEIDEITDSTHNLSSDAMKLSSSTTSSPSASSRFKCCQTNWPTFADYEQHCLSVHNRYPCEECLQTFTCKNNKRRHFNCYHGSKKEISCSLCFKTFSRTDIMKEHRLTHTISYKENKCQVCSFVSEKKSLLLSHLKKCFRKNNANFLDY